MRPVNSKPSSRKSWSGGFTLVEALIAIAVFAIASVIISSIFINVNDLQQNTASFQRLQNDGRYILEKLAREIRGREIEYPIDSEETNLAFRKDESGNYIFVCFDQEAKALKYYITQNSDEDEAACLASGADLNANDVLVEKATFYISPIADDLWGQEPSQNLQPRVTISLTLKNGASTNIKYQKELTLQTMISSKGYRR